MPVDESMSPSVEGLEDYLDEDAPSKGAKTSKKKASTNQAARRDQNRIAQREFRLRKQQKIRDLETRVEILSGTKEETHSHTRAIIQGLMEENARLRSLVRDLSGFMGDGLGGPLLSKTGWTMKQFTEFISRADSDTAYAAFIQAKTGKDPTTPGAGQSPVIDKDGAVSSTRKRKRDSGTLSTGLGNDHNDGPITRGGAYRQQSPNELPSLLPSGQGYAQPSSEGPQNFASLVDTFTTSASAPFITGSSNGQARKHQSNEQYTGGNYSSTNFPFSPATSTPSLSSSAMNQHDSQNQSLRSQEFAENETKRNEAGKLIKYHLDNYRRNDNYFLPASLRPTLVQRTVPHDNLIDGVIYPEVRDRMILLKDQYDLPKCLTEFLWTSIVHGDDVIAHNNWELSEEWLRTYGLLVEESVLNSCNKWRRLRGDRELSLQEINPEAPVAV